MIRKRQKLFVLGMQMDEPWDELTVSEGSDVI